MERACKTCKVIISQGEVCPICNASNLTTKWNGYVIILNAEKSALAKKLGIGADGTYALSVNE